MPTVTPYLLSPLLFPSLKYTLLKPLQFNKFTEQTNCLSTLHVA